MKEKPIHQLIRIDFLAITMVTFLLLLSSQLFAQNAQRISGIVREATDGAPLQGVSVVIKGAGVSTLTNALGSYSIGARSTDTLVFSMLGFESQTIPIGNKTAINLDLHPSQSTLDEVVVIGYGTVNKAELTGSVGVVNMNDMAKAPVASFEEALAGRVAGVQVSSSDGQPGNGMEIVIRGANSLTQSNAPLYVIDGFPIEDPDPAALNPEDIESITILKDASATAIYGSRAANGVVVIETKKGKVGKPVITFNNQLGYQQITNKMDLMSPYEFVRYQQEYHPVSAAEVYLTNGRTLESYREIPAFDFQDVLFQTSSFRNHNIALRGGNDMTRYSVSGSINDQTGVIINSGFKRQQGRVSLDQSVNQDLKVGVNVNYSHNYTYGQRIAAEPGFYTNSIMAKVWGFRPVTGNPDVNLLEDVIDDDEAIFGGSSDIRLNPLITSQNEHIVTRATDLLGNAYVQYELADGLVFKSIGSLRSNRRLNENFYNSNTIQGNPLNPNNSRGVWGSIGDRDVMSWSNENTMQYKTTLSDHKITALGGFSMQGNDFKSSGHIAQNVPNEELGIAGLNQGTPLSITSAASANALQSFFGRMDYNYASKYFITGSFRIDGSSKFAPGNRWAFFPSVALRWNMHNENFLKSVPAISNAALRGSYGASGNNRVDDFSYLSSLSQPIARAYSFNNQTPTAGVISNNLGNHDLKWETTKSVDIALELGLFKNRVELIAEVYQKTTVDLLLNAEMPISSGYLNAFKNIGSLRNEGLELTLNTVNIRSKAFTWESSFNISYYKNRIIGLTDGQEELLTMVNFATGGWNNVPLYVSRIGQPAGMMYGYLWDGVYQYSDFDNPSPNEYVLRDNVPNNGNARTSIKPGDIKYKDLNGDGEVNTADRTIIGRGQPLHIGGFANNLQYRGISLHVFLQWSYGNDIYNANRIMFEGNHNAGTYPGGRNQFASYIDRWSPDNQTNRNYRAGDGAAGPIGMWSSRVVEDGSFLRLKTVSLGYSIPQRYVSRLLLDQLNISVSGQNLLTFTNYSGMDPEVSTRVPSVLAPGFDFSAYPRARTVVFGLNATFK